jgi:hypothetical protein
VLLPPVLVDADGARPELARAEAVVGLAAYVEDDRVVGRDDEPGLVGKLREIAGPDGAAARSRDGAR